MPRAWPTYEKRLEREITCKKCGSIFWHRHSQAKYCSDECSRLGERDSWNKYRLKNVTARRIHSKRMYVNNLEHVLKRTRAYQKTDKGRLVAAKTQQRQIIKSPEKVAARVAVRSALKMGLLKREDCRCGSIQKTQAHHPDYTKPLHVIWLCPPCHRAEHYK